MPPALVSFGAVALALLIGFGALPLLGRDPLAAAGAMLQGSVSGHGAYVETLLKAALLTCTSLAVALPFAGGLFNIGGQGQMLVGAITAAFVGHLFALPGPLGWLVPLGCAMVAGGGWAALAGLLKVRRGVHEVISTILMNWIALHLIENGLVTGPLAARGGSGSSLPGTAIIADGAHLPILVADTRLHAGVLVALGLALLLAYVLSRLRWGFELRAVGASPEAARSSGIPVGVRLVQAMFVGGMCAGLAGALLVLGTEHRYPPHFASPYGFDGIALSFIGANSPLGVLASSLFFGAIRAGGTRLQLLQIHRDFPELIQGIALLLVAAKSPVERAVARWRTARA
jgi:simple sugar transport system permease protein